MPVFWLVIMGPVMNHNHVALGILFLLVALAFLARCHLAVGLRYFLPVAGKIGLVVIVLAEVLLFLQVHWVTIYFTPLIWTGTIMLMDSLVFTVQGASLLQSKPARFFALALWSVPLWLIFEAYNLRLKNWAYVGLPHSRLLSDIGYLWSFATIWPAIFETADFLAATGAIRKTGRPHRAIHGSTLVGCTMLGACFLVLPVMIAPQAGAYLFGMVWIGFALLFDPLNYRMGGHSLLRDWESGNLQTLYCFLASGMVCGVLWEFWNYWAHARWIYVFPIFQNWKIFEMPAPGFLGFPPFAVECFVMFEFLSTVYDRCSPHSRISAEDRRWK